MARRRFVEESASPMTLSRRTSQHYHYHRSCRVSRIRSLPVDSRKRLHGAPVLMVLFTTLGAEPVRASYKMGVCYRSTLRPRLKRMREAQLKGAFWIT